MLEVLVTRQHNGTEMDTNAVALSAIALAATAIGGVIWLAKYFARELSKDLKEHTKAATNLAQAAKEQKQASSEVLTFMKKLNGKLPKLVEEKQREARKES